MQHHYSGRLYDKSDHILSLLNLGFLFWIMALPYPAGLWAHHLGKPGEAGASRILAALLFMPSLFWMLKWFYAKSGERLIDRRLAPDFVRQMTRRYTTGASVLALALLLALIAPRLGLALSFAATAYWILPQLSPATGRGKNPAKRREQMIDRALRRNLIGRLSGIRISDEANDRRERSAHMPR